MWWKRIPGGDYVYPVQATVLAVTAKRVKIEAVEDVVWGGDVSTRWALARDGVEGRNTLALTAFGK